MAWVSMSSKVGGHVLRVPFGDCAYALSGKILTHIGNLRPNSRIIVRTNSCVSHSDFYYLPWRYAIVFAYDFSRIGPLMADSKSSSKN